MIGYIPWQVHFATDMWERRLDGKPILKRSAAPTIFEYFNTKKTRPLPLDLQVQDSENVVITQVLYLCMMY